MTVESAALGAGGCVATEAHAVIETMRPNAARGRRFRVVIKLWVRDQIRTDLNLQSYTNPRQILAPDMEHSIAYRAVKSVSLFTARHTSASRVAVRSRSLSDTISFGECMYLFGTDTSPVATPSRAIHIAREGVATG